MTESPEDNKSYTSQEYIEECKKLQERILQERGGELVPDSVEIIRSMRDDDPDGYYCRYVCENSDSLDPESSSG